MLVQDSAVRAAQKGHAPLTTTVNRGLPGQSKLLITLHHFAKVQVEGVPTFYCQGEGRGSESRRPLRPPWRCLLRVHPGCAPGDEPEPGGPVPDAGPPAWPHPILADRCSAIVAPHRFCPLFGALVDLAHADGRDGFTRFAG